MAIYAIGDIQGCYDDLFHLLDKIDFNKKSDQLTSSTLPLASVINQCRLSNFAAVVPVLVILMV
jgi:hypothetical protein